MMKNLLHTSISLFIAVFIAACASQPKLSQEQILSQNQQIASLDKALKDAHAQGADYLAPDGYEAAAATEAFGLDDYLANRFPLDDQGRLLGTFERPMCYGKGKVDKAERWAADRDVDLDRCYFYSDSYSDAPMLARVGQPRVVAPDLRLHWIGTDLLQL